MNTITWEQFKRKEQWMSKEGDSSMFIMMELILELAKLLIHKS